MLKLIFLSLISLSFVACTSSDPNGSEKGNQSHKMETKEVTYSSEGQEMKGFMAIPSGDGPFPVVLVVHEWWGQTEYPKERARQLAEAGYVGFAVDMYGDGKTASHPKDAKAFSGKVMQDLDGAQKRFQAALDHVKQHKKVNPKNVGAMGYCFGGAIVLEMARRGLDLDVVGSYHGNLNPIVSQGAEGIEGKVLVFHGGDDPFIPKQDIASFRQKMDKAGVDYDFVSYKGAVHGFTNPEATKKGKEFDLPLAYDKKAAKDSWKKTIQAFEKVW